MAIPRPVHGVFQRVRSGLAQGGLVGRVIDRVGVVLRWHGSDKVQAEPAPVGLVGCPGQGQVPVPGRVDSDHEFSAFAGLAAHDALQSSLPTSRSA